MANLKAQARRFYETIDRQDWPGLARLVAPDFRSQVGGAPRVDHFEWQGMLRAFFVGFPDGRHVIEYYEAEGDRVVTIGHFEGTHTGTFRGVPPSGNKVSVGVIHIDRFVDGTLVEHFGQLDSLGLMQQVGTQMSGKVTNPEHRLLQGVYEAFNARDIVAALATMHPNVEWPNGMEGGYVHGHGGVRDYWTRQWGLIDPHVEPLRFAADDTGRIVIDVHQVVRDRTGAVIVDAIVQYAYLVEGGLIRGMEIRRVAHGPKNA